VHTYGNAVVIGTARKHPKSLWKDESLKPRELHPTRDGDIFKVLMPWLDERKAELQQNKPKKKSVQNVDAE
jgi:hypothetical protein